LRYDGLNSITAAALRPQVAQYTSDIHFLPNFLRLDDFPGYIKYLINTRHIETVLMSNSQLIYEILPALAEQNPQVKWIDYVRLPFGSDENLSLFLTASQ
jgi:hypothetical protein